LNRLEAIDIYRFHLTFGKKMVTFIIFTFSHRGFENVFSTLSRYVKTPEQGT